MNKKLEMAWYGQRKNRPTIDKAVFLKVLKEKSNQLVKTVKRLNYVFMSDDGLLQINQQYLNHNTYTDIITFDLSNNEDIIGEIYISLDRVQENAELYKQPIQHEFLRVLFHGALHLLGYKDKNKTDEAKMREAENECINLYFETLKRETFHVKLKKK